MTAKEQLNAIRDEDRAIQNAIERVDNWYDAATRGTGSMEAERVSGTGERSRVETAVCRMVDYEREQRLTARIDALVDMRQAAERIIKRIQAPRQRELLRLRYLQDRSWEWTWDKIAEKMQISRRSVDAVHGGALQEYEIARYGND